MRAALTTSNDTGDTITLTVDGPTNDPATSGLLAALAAVLVDYGYRDDEPDPPPGPRLGIIAGHITSSGPVSSPVHVPIPPVDRTPGGSR